MSDYHLKSGKIPSNIDLDEILNGVEGNKTKIRYLKDGMTYFLSLLVYDNYDFIKWKVGYKRLNDNILSDIIGNYRPSLITKILKDKNVIEVIPHSKGHCSKGYRLTPKYSTGDYRFVSFSPRITDKLIIYQTYKKINEVDLNQKFSYIINQFQKNNLIIDKERSDDFIRKLGVKLFQMTILMNEYQRGFTLYSLFNYLGRMLNLIEDINEQQFRLSVSPSNHRFHSNITSLPKILRPFIKINNQEVGEVDISTSQPYILSTILRDEFTTSDVEGYNISTIYKELYDELNSVKSFIPSNKRSNPIYLGGIFMSKEEHNGLSRFLQIDFQQDFYEHILIEGNRLYPEYMKSRKSFLNGRTYIKKHIMNYLFDRNDYHREDNDVIYLLKKIYPEVSKYIENFNHDYGSSKFSLLLQRTESYLMLDNVCGKINTEYPDIPFYTVHGKQMVNPVF